MKYLHDEKVHNLEAPREIVPIILKLLQPSSVVDVGCGIGTFLRVFKEHGVSTVLGVDGSWVNRQLLEKHISRSEFLERDLEAPLALDRRFDLVVSLEVAEHLKADTAERFVRSLTDAGDAVVFSAAIPGQSGQNHVNEQPMTYWIELFRDRGYRFSDVLRPVIWRNEKVPTWYRQNICLFLKHGVHIQIPASDESMADVIHPESWQANCHAHLLKLNRGEAPLVSYLKPLAKRIAGHQLRKLWMRAK